MPVIENHPLRLRRVRAGLSQSALAEAAGLTRATVAQVEEGRSRPSAKLVLALAQATHTGAALVVQEFNDWSLNPEPPRLSHRATQALGLPPEALAGYASFAQWRGDIAPNTTAFASLLRVPRTTVVKYEATAQAAMPKSVYRALSVTLKLSDEYLAALEELHDR